MNKRDVGESLRRVFCFARDRCGEGQTAGEIAGAQGGTMRSCIVYKHMLFAWLAAVQSYAHAILAFSSVGNR